MLPFSFSGREENKQISPFTFAASLVFFDSRFVTGAVCVEDTSDPKGKFFLT